MEVITTLVVLSGTLFIIAALGTRTESEALPLIAGVASVILALMALSLVMAI